jgi:hypothetical protein
MNSTQNLHITSALHPADVQVQGAHRPPGMGYGATGFNNRSPIPSSHIVAHSKTNSLVIDLCLALVTSASIVPRGSTVNL